MRITSISAFAGMSFALWSGTGSGCAHSTQPPSQAAAASGPEAVTATTPAENDEIAASVTQHHQHHSHGGVTAFIAMSLDTIGSDETKKQQIAKIQSDLNDRVTPAREAENKLITTLSEGLAAGAIDPTKASAAVSDLARSAGILDDTTLATLQQLHQILSASERTALIDKVKAHWEVWQKANASEPEVGKTGAQLAMLTEHLSLTPEQVEAISTRLKAATSELHKHFDPQDIETLIQAFTQAFASESFEPKALSNAANANARMAEHGGERMALFYESVAPVLTPDQRTELAQHLQEHQTHNIAVEKRG